MSLLRRFANLGCKQAAGIPRVRPVRRRLGCETLESRRLLVAEGALFTFDGEFDAGGVVGDVSAIVRWGDGTTSPVNSIAGGDPTGNLRIRFDYSLDTGGFFSNPLRRTLLQTAADSLIQRFADDLAAITPGGLNEWQPSVFHPSSGPANQLAGTVTALPKNLPVAANEIIIYAGARDLPGANRGVGGQASFSFPSTQISCATQAECDQKLADIEAFRNVVRGRGEPGALASPQTDVAPHIGTVSFDSNSDWYFSLDGGGIGSGQIDFLSVAVHEIAHVLGFGITRLDVTTSWARLSSTGVFTGPIARTAYEGSGNPPVESNHWARSVLDQVGQRTLMAAEIQTGVRQLFTTMDFAAMNDLGWNVLNTRATVSAEHRFPDDGEYPVDLVLQGSRGGEVVHRIDEVTVTNVAPTVIAVGNQAALVGQPFSITNIAEITDPGFTNNQADPASSEVFTYTIDWGDGSPIDEGTATIDGQGTANGALTRASLDGTHTYDTSGTRLVTIRVTDDDGASGQATFSVDVPSPPGLTLELSKTAIFENDGDNAAMLTIRRSGTATGINQVIDLTSNDTSEATVQATAVIPGNATFVSVPVNAIDDALLDGDLTVQLTATGAGVVPDSIALIVRDREALRATFSADELREDATAAVDLVVRRSNTDTAETLVVSIAGGNSSELDVPASVTIPANQQQVSVALLPINDNDPEPNLALTYTFTADGYELATAALDLLDDEPPLFQNPISRFDVNNNGDVTAGDALRVINQLAIRGGPADLNPESEQPNGVFFDVNGDYRISALDALVVINEVGRRLNSQSVNSEAIAFAVRADINPDGDDDDDDLRAPWDVDVGQSLV